MRKELFVLLPISLLSVGLVGVFAGLSAKDETLAASGDSYSLTINYLKRSDGSVAAPQYVKTLREGAKYSVASPTVSGLIPVQESVKGRIYESLNVNVYYDTYDTWDGTSSASLAGNGTAESPYLIQSAEDLAYVSSNSASKTAFQGQYFKMTTSVDMSGHEWEAIATGNHGKGVGSFVSWFCGNFDGDNHAIANLTINATSTIHGLFSGVKDSTIENLYLSGSVTGASRIGSVAYVVNGNSTIRNVHSTMSLTTTNATDGLSGGIFGITYTATGTVLADNCSYSGTITAGGTYIGGIAGGHNNKGFTVKNCINNGKVTAKGTCGGIVGGSSKSVIIENSQNYGDIKGTTADNTSYVGGIVGYLSADLGSATDVSNYGDVFGVGCLGGIIGSGNNKNHTLANAINKGDITGTGSKVAGIAGAGGGMTVSTATNYGSIKGTSSVGGISGEINNSAVYSDLNNYGNLDAINSGAYNGLITGYHGIGSTIAINPNNVIKGTLLVNGVQSTRAFGYTNCVEIAKYYNGKIVGYEAVQPGETYTPTPITPDVESGYQVSPWFMESSLENKYAPSAYGTAGTNGQNKLLISIYSRSTRTYSKLLSDLETADTCTEYNLVDGFRADISLLSDAEQTSILQETVDESCTVEEKLNYMDYLKSLNSAKYSNSILPLASENSTLIIESLMIGAAIIASVIAFVVYTNVKHEK
ncbi:MAG: hypothetical protein MJ239_01250 [Bacilli bacterium]|nr:hypothetical protein [Bacilli bacterium]